MGVCFISLLILTIFLTVFCDGKYQFETKFIKVPIDHFSFVNTDDYKMKYLINDTYWQSGGPIFFYTGNEGPIEVFAQNSGFIWEIAPQFNAMLVFAEHRYYGESLPFGNASFSNEKLGYLNTQQALADYVYLVDAIQKDLVGKNEGLKSKVIAFGGSYGGMLAAWMRLKYSGSVFGALASSAPIFQFEGLTKCEKFNQVLTSVFQSSARPKSNCVKNIKKSWSTIRDLTGNDDGKNWLSSTLKLCDPLKTSDDVKKLTEWLEGIYANLAMVNYPYPTDFLTPLPAYPVMEFCANLDKELTGKPLMEALHKSISIYANYTGSAKCVDTNSTSRNVDETVWDYQSCTEMIMPMCAKANSMFEKSDWNFTQFADACSKRFKSKVTRDDLAIVEYGGREATYTNVIFTNGLLDPWSGGGFWPSAHTAYAILIPNAAHHLELRASNPKDPVEVVAARKQIEKILGTWVKPGILN